MLALLEKLKSEKVISELNYQFAKMIDRKQQKYGYTPQQQNLAILLAALLSFHSMKGHSALRLHSTEALDPFELSSKENLPINFSEAIKQKIGQITPLQWASLLEKHIAFSTTPENIAPMLFQQDLLYFYRYWQAENHIAKYLQQAVEFKPDIANLDQTIEMDKQLLNRLFPDEAPHEINWQKVAVATALRNRFCMISGGPGTGKTTTVAKLLIALQEKQISSGKPELKIALAAPTGKASARLKESIENSLKDLKHLASNLAIPTNASTIHSLLGIRPQSDMPTYYAKNPLHFDLLVVDEGSMVDLSIMEKLMNALKPSTRLIILGDKDQLASVEAGAIMGELGEFIRQGYSQAHCDYLYQVTGYELSAKKVLPICDSLCHLQKSYRFNENSGIGQLAKKVNAKEAVKSWQLFANLNYADLSLNEYPSANSASDKYQWSQNCVALVVSKAVELYRDYFELVKQRKKEPKSVQVSDIFEAFQKVRFLSALRVGDLGVERLNQAISEELKRKGLVEFVNPRDRYIGKPLLITENSRQNKINSGDIGIVLPDKDGNLRVYFDTKENGEHLSLSLSRVPEAETAYVMTVHKSQGSEFAHTLLIMPLTTSPVLTKELVYTAVTRAKEKFTLFSRENVWRKAIEKNVERQSGLKVQLESGICK